jgi:hypothetical protein
VCSWPVILCHSRDGGGGHGSDVGRGHATPARTPIVTGERRQPPANSLPTRSASFVNLLTGTVSRPKRMQNILTAAGGADREGRASHLAPRRPLEPFGSSDPRVTRPLDPCIHAGSGTAPFVPRRGLSERRAQKTDRLRAPRGPRKAAATAGLDGRLAVSGHADGPQVVDPIYRSDPMCPAPRQVA